VAGKHAKRADVVLIAMPWQVLYLPSIQLGVLQAVLERAGIRTAVRSFNLAFMEHCRREMAARPEAEHITLDDYEAVAAERSFQGLGDWIFAVPPFPDAPERDGRYLSGLREQGFTERTMAKMLALRKLVPAFLARCAEDVLALRPRVVGFTSSFSQNVSSLVLAKILKQRDASLAIMLGGANCDGPMGAALQRAFPWVDVVVRGEGEQVVPEVVKDLLGGGPLRPQPGLCYRGPGGPVAIPQDGHPSMPLDEVPAPIYDEYFERLALSSFAAELSADVRLPFEGARGCWWGAKSHCTFCGLNGAAMSFRSKSPERVVREVAALARRYHRLDFQAMDNILDFRYLRDVFPALRDAGYDLGLFYEVKPNLTRDQVRLLRTAGVDWIQPGIESLSTPILRLMRKGVTAFQNIRLLKWCAEEGLGVLWNVIYDLPGEPAGEYQRMADLIPSLVHLAPPNLTSLRLDRFSPYAEQPEQWGLQVLGPLPYYRLIYPVDEATLSDLAYAFAHRHLDGREPKSYVGALAEAVKAWRENTEGGYRSLRFRRGPGFLVIRDRRPGLEAADYTFEDPEARLYLACADGATPQDAWAALPVRAKEDLGVDDVREFLDELVGMRLAYKEGGRYLALALPANLPEEI
jgi:ribosomal peptide maturation radical SAM protein 1